MILTDGDLLTLSNMKLNLERNHLNYEDELLKQHGEAESSVSRSFFVLSDSEYT